MANASQKLLEQGEEQRREQHTADGGGRLAVAPDAIVVASVVQIPPRSLARNTAAGAPAALEQRRAAALPLRRGAAAVRAPGTRERERRDRERDEHGTDGLDPIDWS